METQKKGAPPCGLYLVLPKNWMEPEFLKNFRDVFRAINASPYEKNSHVIEFRGETETDHSKDQIEIITALCDMTKSQGIVFVVSKDMSLAKACGADGVMLDDAEQISPARTFLGEDAIIGLRCGQSRRVAEKALEYGADYVSFSGNLGGLIDPSIIEWWHYKTDNPCLVEGRLSNDDCAFYVTSGADFIDASAYVFDHPDGVMKGIVNMAYAIDLALEQAKEQKAS